MRRLRFLPVLPLACLLTALAGCAAQRAEILGDGPTAEAGAAHIQVPEDEYFWVSTPPNGRHGAPSAEAQVLKDGVWVSEGWLTVQFQCYSPKDAPHPTEYPILPEGPDEKAVFIKAGHRYLLHCDPRRMGRFEMDDEPSATK